MKPSQTTTTAKKAAAKKTATQKTASTSTPETSAKPPVATGEITNADGGKNKIGFELVSESPIAGVTYTGRGVIFAEGTTYETWFEIGNGIAQAAKISMFLLGDWLNFGTEKFPKDYKKAVEATGLAYGTLRTVASICQKFPPEKRFEGLSFEHHRLLGPVKDEETRKKLAEQAITENMSASAMRELIPTTTEQTPEQIAKREKLADEKHQQACRDLMLYIANLPLKYRASWYTLVHSTIEVLEKAQPTCKTAFDNRAAVENAAKA